MSLSGINFSGLSTGIDTDSIVKQLVGLAQRPVRILQARQQQIQQQQIAINQIAATLAGFQAAAAALDNTTSFSSVKATSSDTSVATVSASLGAQPGNHTLQVIQLAQAHRLAATPQTSQTTPLGVSGQIVINGKAINIAASDTLQTIASHINSAKVGVNATIISTEANSYTLVLTSQNTGTANTIQLSDTGTSTILRTTLGLIDAGTSIANPITNGAASSRFADSSSSVGTLLGLTAPQSGTVQIDGVDIAIDFATDSLSAIASKINAAAIPGVSASIVATTDPVSGASRQELHIVGDSTPTFADSNNILTNLGILSNTPTNELAAAKDAIFSINGLQATRRSNTISDVISGVTFTLLKDADTPSTQITINTDIETIKSNIKTFVNQYNQLIRTIKDLASFDPETLTGGPLFGDVTVQSLMDSLTQRVTDSISGLSGPYVALSQVGITLDQTGTLHINDSQLTAALETNLADVEKLFRAIGVASDSSVSYVSSTEKTRPSTSTGYAIYITQVAAQATLTASTQHTADDNPNVETLTFTGIQFGASGYTVFLDPYSTLDGIVSKINADSTLSAILTASNVEGRLRLTAKQYGSAYSFTVVSSQPAANNNSGIGNTPVDATGLDVAGTINGEAASGKGQFLTGNTGNANTEGLQIRVTATVAGSLGTVTFTKGIANQVKEFAAGSTDFISGTLTLYSRAMDEQVSEIGKEIAALQERIKSEESRMRAEFAAMEAAVSQIRAASVGLAGLTNLYIQR
jgi:flagellar hook-associated protein 2